MTAPGGPRPSARPPVNGRAPASGPSLFADPEPPTEQVPVVDVPPSHPTQGVPLVPPLPAPPPAPADPVHPGSELPTEVVTVVPQAPGRPLPPRRGWAPPDRAPVEQGPPTEGVPVVPREPEPRTAAVKVIPPDLFTRHLPRDGEADPSGAAAPSGAAQDGVEPGAAAPGAGRRLPVDVSPAALRRTWVDAQPPTVLRRAFLAALLAPLVHVVIIVLGVVFVALAYGSYSVSTVLGGSAVGVAGWLVGAVVALWVGVQARAGRAWAAIALVVLAVAALGVTIDLVLATLTWIGLSGLPGVVRLSLLALAALLCVAVPVLMIGPLRRGYFGRPRAAA